MGLIWSRNQKHVKTPADNWTESGLFNNKLCLPDLELSEQEISRLKDFTRRYKEILSKPKFKLGNGNFLTASITLKPNAGPIGLSYTYII